MREVRGSASRSRPRIHRLGEAEVEDLDGAVGPKLHVRRFQIAMDDALFVGCLQGVGDLASDRECVGDRDRSAADHHRQILAVDQLHHERGAAVRRADEAVDLGDVRMVQRRERVRFPGEASDALGVRGEERRQDLDCYVTMKLGVAGAIDLAHTACAQGARHLVNAQTGSWCQRHGLGVCFP